MAGQLVFRILPGGTCELWRGSGEHVKDVAELSVASVLAAAAEDAERTGLAPSVLLVDQALVPALRRALCTTLTTASALRESPQFATTMCVGVMLVYLQAILKPLIFAIFLMYMLAPAVRWLTTPVRIRLPRRRASRSHDDEELQKQQGSLSARSANGTCNRLVMQQTSLPFMIEKTHLDALMAL